VDPELHDMIERLCPAANLPKPKIAIMDAEMSNAFAIRRSQGNAMVVVIQGIKENLNTSEMPWIIKLLHYLNLVDTGKLLVA